MKFQEVIFAIMAILTIARTSEAAELSEDLSIVKKFEFITPASTEVDPVSHSARAKAEGANALFPGENQNKSEAAPANHNSAPSTSGETSNTNKAKMADFWPIPSDKSKIFLRVYDYHGPTGDAPKHMIQKVFLESAEGETYFRVEDWVRDYTTTELKFRWVSTWHMKKSSDGTVTETGDKVGIFNSDYTRALYTLDMTYRPENEILWGNEFDSTNDLATVKGKVLINESISTVTSFSENGTSSESKYPEGTAGYNWISLLGNFKNFKVKDTKYDVSLFKLYQTFCPPSGCGAQAWEVYVNYYMVKDKGAVQMDYYRRPEGGTEFLDKGSHMLTSTCETGLSEIDCQ